MKTILAVLFLSFTLAAQTQSVPGSRPIPTETLASNQLQAEHKPEPNPKAVAELLKVRLRMSQLAQQFEALKNQYSALQQEEQAKTDVLKKAVPEGFTLEPNELTYVEKLKVPEAKK